MQDTTKTCPRCETDLPLDAFGVNRSRRDGRQSCCLECRRSYRASKQQRAAVASYNASDAAAEAQYRYTMSGQGKATRRTYYQKPEVRERYVEHRARYYRRNPTKTRARTAVRDALDSGSLVRGPCAFASDACEGRIEAHHHKGYDREHWLDVVWLCIRHHGHAHRSTKAS